MSRSRKHDFHYVLSSVREGTRLNGREIMALVESQSAYDQNEATRSNAIDNDERATWQSVTTKNEASWQKERSWDS